MKKPRPRFDLRMEEPYDLRLMLDRHTIAKFSLDDAPVHDWNAMVERIAQEIVAHLNIDLSSRELSELT